MASCGRLWALQASAMTLYLSLIDTHCQRHLHTPAGPPATAAATRVLSLWCGARLCSTLNRRYLLRTLKRIPRSALEEALIVSCWRLSAGLPCGAVSQQRAAPERVSTPSITSITSINLSERLSACAVTPRSPWLSQVLPLKSMLTLFGYFDRWLRDGLQVCCLHLRHVAPMICERVGGWQLITWRSFSSPVSTHLRIGGARLSMPVLRAAHVSRPAHGSADATLWVPDRVAGHPYTPAASARARHSGLQPGRVAPRRTGPPRRR